MIDETARGEQSFSNRNACIFLQSNGVGPAPLVTPEFCRVGHHQYLDFPTFYCILLFYNSSGNYFVKLFFIFVCTNSVIYYCDPSQKIKKTDSPKKYIDLTQFHSFQNSTLQGETPIYFILGLMSTQVDSFNYMHKSKVQ